MLDESAYRVPAGHRLRVAVSTAYWPMIWPSPEPVSLDAARRPRSTLPVRPLAKATRSTFPQPEGAAPWRDRDAPRRRIPSAVSSATQKTGIVTLSIVDDFGEVRDLDHGLVNGSIARETWTIHPDDPLSARGETHWTQTLSRTGWSVRTETFADDALATRKLPPDGADQSL